MTKAYEDITLDRRNGVATITINRPDRMNAIRSETVEELVDAVGRAGWSKDIGVVVLTGAGAHFCVGGDQVAHKEGESGYGGRGTLGLPIEELHSIIRDVPVPMIAKVRGYSIGGGNVLALLCDLTIASETAVFGQVGPKVGSVDPGFGTALLARTVGEKKAREIWYLCRRYPAHEALRMGLCNHVVPDAELDAEVDRWCAGILEKSPTALAIAKRSFNADSEHIRGREALGMTAVGLYYGTEESQEGVKAFLEKRRPDFRKFSK